MKSRLFVGQARTLLGKLLWELGYAEPLKDKSVRDDTESEGSLRSILNSI